MKTHSHAATPGRARGPMVAGLIIGAIVLVGAMATVPAYVEGASRRAVRLALRPDPVMSGLVIPEFELTDQDGRPFTRQSLLGHVTIVDFVFTNCPFVCPTLTQKMLYLQESLAGTGVRFLSVSVDPEHDTPDRLAEHARAIGADQSVWRFVTGDPAVILRLSEEGLHLGLGPDPSQKITLADGAVMDNIAHTSKLTLVGPKGEPVAFFSGLDQADVERLAERAAAAAGRSNR